MLTEQHSVFVDCLKEVDHRVDLTMMWEGVGLKVSKRGRLNFGCLMFLFARISESSNS